MRMNTGLFAQLQSETPREALATYRRYLMQRNASYLRLEAEAGTAFQPSSDEPDPFDAPTGYHNIRRRSRCPAWCPVSLVGWW